MEQYYNDQMTNYQLQLNEALRGVRKAAQGGREDELFYDYLISKASFWSFIFLIKMKNNLIAVTFVTVIFIQYDIL